MLVGAKRKETFRIYFGLLLAELICVSAFTFELARALGGNSLSWAYVFEWPILGLYAVYMTRTMLREVRTETEPVVIEEHEDDPQLKAWNDYLAKIHASD